MDNQDTKRILREIYILRHLDSSFVVGLKNVFPSPNFNTDKTMYVLFSSFSRRYVVMDYMITDLYKVISSPQFFEIDHVRYILYQILCGTCNTDVMDVGCLSEDLRLWLGTGDCFPSAYASQGPLYWTRVFQ